MSTGNREDGNMPNHEERLADIARRREAAERALQDVIAEQEPAVIAAWQDGVDPQDIARGIGWGNWKVAKVIRHFERADEYAAKEADRKRRLGEAIRKDGMKPRDS